LTACAPIRERNRPPLNASGGGETVALSPLWRRKMAVSGPSSLERTNGRPLCPQCRAPMWSIRFQPEKAADDKRTFQCPRCEHSQNVRFSSAFDICKDVRFGSLADYHWQLSIFVSASGQTHVCFAVYPRPLSTAGELGVGDRETARLHLQWQQV
jgi:hypothetical protein